MYKNNLARMFYISFKNGFKLEIGEQYLSEEFEEKEIPKILRFKECKMMYYFDTHLSCQWIDCSEIVAIGFRNSNCN